jgi:phenylacetate-CoA ligase
MRDWLAPVIRHVIAPVWAIKERSPYLRHLRALEHSQFLSEEELRARQWPRLKRILAHAYSSCPFYRRFYDSHGITPSDIRSWTDFRSIPLLSKRVIRENADDMVSQNVRRDQLIPVKTSGSTGISLFFYMDEPCRQWRRACAARHDRWAGWDIGERVGYMWTPPATARRLRARLRNALLIRGCNLAPLRITEQDMEDFARRLIRRPVAVLCGITHAIYLFALFARSRGLHQIRPRGVICAAMVLPKNERETIESAFHTRVFDRYGCEEVSLIASECEAHTGLHINMDALVVEVLRDGRLAKPGEAGEVVVTDLTNYAFPFIRYQLADVASLLAQKCPCGRGLSMLSHVEGRTADYVVTPDRALVSGISLTEYLALLIPHVQQAQIVQERIDFIRFRIVRAPGFNEDSLRCLDRLVRQRLGSRMKYECEFVDRIAQDPSGKYRFLISKVRLSWE